jgi:hypothetical protein
MLREQALIFQQTTTIAKWGAQIGPPGVSAGALRPTAILPADVSDATRRPQRASTRGARQQRADSRPPRAPPSDTLARFCSTTCTETASSSTALRVERGRGRARGLPAASVALGARGRVPPVVRQRAVARATTPRGLRCAIADQRTPSLPQLHGLAAGPSCGCGVAAPPTPRAHTVWTRGQMASSWSPLVPAPNESVSKRRAARAGARGEPASRAVVPSICLTGGCAIAQYLASSGSPERTCISGAKRGDPSGIPLE